MLKGKYYYFTEFVSHVGNIYERSSSVAFKCKTDLKFCSLPSKNVSTACFGCFSYSLRGVNHFLNISLNVINGL